MMNRGGGGRRKGGADRKIRDKNRLAAVGGVCIEEVEGHGREKEGKTYRR